MATWLIAGLPVAGEPAAAAATVDGAMVEDAPALYRLPLVATTPETAEAVRVAARPDAVATSPVTEAAPTDTEQVLRPSLSNVPPPYNPYTLSPANRTTQLVPAVQRGYTLAQRGAFFAARTEFIQVLRRVAQAQDAAASSDEHASALAAGLRALDEVEDFVPAGVQLEAELDVLSVASSHRTPVLQEFEGKLLPHEAVSLYHQFARQQLARVAAGDQAGSMALYGLGRIYSQLADRRDDDVQYVGSAMTMYAAALDARSDNHLAANELGVLMCRTGRPDEAARLFERAIDVAPSAVAYHNLAVAQQKLGYQGEAQANEQESQRLAAIERSQGAVSRKAGIQWVTPQDMARAAPPAPLMSNPQPSVKQAATAPPLPAPDVPKKSPWQKTVELAKSLPRPGSTNSSSQAATGTPPASVPQPTQWR